MLALQLTVSVTTQGNDSRVLEDTDGSEEGHAKQSRNGLGGMLMESSMKESVQMN